MSVSLEKLREILRELIRKELKEASVTANIAGYETPRAFRPKKKKKKNKMGYDEGHADPLVGTSFLRSIDPKLAKVLWKKRLGEGKYHRWRDDPDTNPRQKIGSSIREVKNQLTELERVVKMNVKLKNEMGVSPQDYWKNTHKALNRISERLVKLANKIGQLY